MSHDVKFHSVIFFFASQIILIHMHQKLRFSNLKIGQKKKTSEFRAKRIIFHLEIS